VAWTLFTKTLYQRRTALLWYSVSVAFYSVFIAWYFPYMERINIQQYLKAFPKELIEAFAGSSVNLSSFGGYLATEYLGLIWVAIVAAAVITFATKSLSSEVAGGTMELVLAQPVSRGVLVVTRWLAMLVYSAVLIASTTVPLYLAALWRDVTVDVGNLVLVSAVGLLLAMAIGGVAYALAALFRESGRPAGIVGGILVLMWLLSFMAANLEWAKSLNVVNLFHYWEPARMVDQGTVNGSVWIVYGVLALLGPVVAVLIFSRRDVG
jgi:beta-exotoxin I transport system permease protein